MNMRRCIFAAVALLFLVYCVFFWVQKRDADERERILSDLQNAGIAVDPDDASIETLRLKWFVEVNTIDPIFAIEGTDPVRLRKSLSLLYKKEADLIRYYPSDEQSVIASALYPTDFLNLLPDLETQRIGLFAHPSPESASGYHSLLMRTIHAYDTGLTSLSREIRASTSTRGSYIFIGQTTNRATFIETLDTLAKSARNAGAKATQRFRCLSFYAPRCESIQELLVQRADSIPVPEPATPPDPAVSKMDTVLHTINSQVWPPYSERTLPPLLAGHSNCYPYPTTYLRVWWQTLPGGGEARKSSITNDIYLNEVIPEQNPVYRQTYAQGARLKYQVSGHYYLCADAGIEVSRTQAALSVYSLLREQRIFSTSEDAPLADLARRESAIRTGTYIDERSVAEFVRDSAGLIATRGYSSLSRDIGASQVDRLETMIALWRGGSSGFDEVIREASFESEFVSLFQQKEHMPLFVLLFTRSYASVLFLSGNKTFSPHAPSFANALIETAYPLALFKDKSFNELLRAGSTTSELINEVVKTSRIESSVLRQHLSE